MLEENNNNTSARMGINVLPSVQRKEINTAEYKTKADLRFYMVFTTQYREPVLSYAMLTKIREKMNEKAASLNCIIHIANGYLDHLHLLVSTPPKISLSKIVGSLKGFSSNEMLCLYWQTGFFAVTVSPQDVNGIFHYI